MSTPWLVELDGVTKRFSAESAAAISEVTSKISGGHVTGLVGPDGSGKTTLMRLIAGLLLPTRGTILACGYDTRTELAAIRSCVSYMPQRFGLYEDLTVSENLSVYSDLRGVVGDARKSTIARLMQFTGLAPFVDRLAGKLSGGMKQKLGLACSLIQTPKLLLLDEPSVGVDPISRREFWKLVYDLIDQGIAVVWSTAYLDEAERCKTVMALDRGRAIYDGPPGELTSRMQGRSYLIRGVERKRRVLSTAMQHPNIIDGVIQGDSVRIVMKAQSPPPTLDMFQIDQGDVVATPPRFEDAFVDLLGGSPKLDSALTRMKSNVSNRFENPSNISNKHDHAGDAVVQAQSLTKTFGNFTAAKDVSFEIARGEIFGLLGPNGAGKSTTFKMLCGLLSPTSGHARVVGYDLYHSGGIARAKLGYMAQKFSLYGDLSTRQNLDFFSGIYGLKGRHRHDVIDRMVDAFELAPFLKTNAKELPLGFKQRLALACAVLHDPPVLFLDEPTSGVDPLTRREFWAHINAMVEVGVTVLVTTHFLEEAEYCDRIALVYQGQVIATGSPDDLKALAKSSELEEPSLEDAFISLVEAFDLEPSH